MQVGDKVVCVNLEEICILPNENAYDHNIDDLELYKIYTIDDKDLSHLSHISLQEINSINSFGKRYYRKIRFKTIVELRNEKINKLINGKKLL